MSSSSANQIAYFNTLIGKEINAAYRIEEQLAIGGMGAVFRASQLHDNSRVAVKVIAPQLAASNIFVKRFKREAKVGFLLSHPNIVKVYEYGETTEGLLFMVMEFIEGITLGSFLEKNAPLKLDACLDILHPLSQALDAAHKRNILHRDLKPANVLISKDGRSRQSLKLVDFGLLKLLESDSEITQGSNLTGMGEACGTPIYMSPEQILGQPLAPTADVYSLGVMLFQMLTGRLPIEASNIRQILSSKINQEPPRVSDKYPFVPSVIDDVLLKALARNPRNRYQTAGELYLNFQRVAAEITAEFSQPTHPSLNKDMLDEIRQENEHLEEISAAEFIAQTSDLSEEFRSPVIKREARPTTPLKIDELALKHIVVDSSLQPSTSARSRQSLTDTANLSNTPNLNSSSELSQSTHSYSIAQPAQSAQPIEPSQSSQPVPFTQAVQTAQPLPSIQPVQPANMTNFVPPSPQPQASSLLNSTYVLWGIIAVLSLLLVITLALLLLKH